MESYGYLGLGLILNRYRPGNVPDLTVGLDNFGQVQNWTWANGATSDGFSYTYNYNGTIATKDDQTWSAHTTYGYDRLGRRTSDSRGAISITRSGGTDTLTAGLLSWTMDCLGSRYGGKYGSAYAADGQPTNQSFSADGNERSVTFGGGNTDNLKFDAWNRLSGKRCQEPICQADSPITHQGKVFLAPFPVPGTLSGPPIIPPSRHPAILSIHVKPPGCDHRFWPVARDGRLFAACPFRSAQIAGHTPCCDVERYPLAGGARTI